MRKLLPLCFLGVAASIGLRAAAAKASTAAGRRALHRELAESAQDEIVRARHLALATTIADTRLAGAVASAAAGALRRGAAHDAVDLAAHAVRLTPPAAADRPGRLP
jgi:hypothetical protein